MNENLSQIGARQREHHFHLSPHHRCYYWGEYTPWGYTHGRNADFSETNSFIADLKISPEMRGTPEWERKLQAIDLAGRAFARFWRWRELADKCLLVAISASRSHDDPLYDDRVEQILERIRTYSGAPVTCLRLLESDGSLQPSHGATNRPKISRLTRSIRINRQVVPLTPPKMIFLFDDVLTTGAHFVASCSHIHRLFPESRVVGNFIARSRRPDANEELRALQGVTGGNTQGDMKGPTFKE